MISAPVRPVIPAVISQHAGESAILRHTRSVLVKAPHVKLLHRARPDDRIAAHLDGLAVAGDEGRRPCTAALENPGVGEVFAAAVRAIEECDGLALGKLFAIAQAVPESRAGLLSAFGWVAPEFLQGTTRALVDSGSASQRLVGLVACRMHRLDPGTALVAAMADADAPLRAGALRGRGGTTRSVACLKAASDDDPDCRFWGGAPRCCSGIATALCVR